MRRKKRQNKQLYVVGILMILLTFSLAFVLIYASSLNSDSVDADISSPPSSTQKNEESSTTVDAVSSKPLPPPDKESAISSDVPINQGTMAFTSEEIAQIEALIKDGENSQVAAVAGGSVSDTPTSDTSSQKEYKIAVPSNVSIYFKDLGSGYVYQNNEDYKYFIASLIKAPYCMYLYTMAEQGKCDLDEILTIEYKDIQIGTGKIREKKPAEFPLQMSVRELMSFTIRYSDNTAMEKLRKKYNHVDYLSYAKSLGIHYPEDVGFVVNGKITAKDAGVYINAIHDYINTGKYGSELKEHMLHTINPMILSKYPVIRKYGWAELAFHDMTIIDAPHPYLLVILSDKGLGTKPDHKLYNQISTLIGSFQAKWYE